MNAIEFFLILYFISAAFIYALQHKGNIPFTIPGDIYIHIGTKRIYLPLASSLVLALLLFLLLNRFRNGVLRLPPRP